ncbi:MAG: ROK family protein [Chlamydiales bacterium]|nr:ROK family protein [Chlamydiia bacterium]MCP5507738.1 ROK family protein [Chlamydiales bacterium]
MTSDLWAAGVDLGGTKIQVIQVNADGSLGERIRISTDVDGGAQAVEKQISEAVRDLQQRVGTVPVGVGIGVAGQVEKGSGIVKFAPNLQWSNEPFQQRLREAMQLPVVVINDVRAATWGEWLHGAGLGSEDLLCVFVGTGIGGGIVSGGHMLEGYNNTAGEIGHIIVKMGGPECTCGSYGCAEAIAGGWGIARRAQEAVRADLKAGSAMLALANGDSEQVSGKVVDKAADAGDPLALQLMEETGEAIGALVTGLVNAFSPRRIILGGGVIEGHPELIDQTATYVRRHALKAASEGIEMLHAKLHNDAGAIGAGALAIRKFVTEKELRR